MKNLNLRIAKAVFVLLFVFMSSISYGQLNFKDSNLAFLEKIAFAKYKDIEKVLKESNYELTSGTKNKSYHNFYFEKPKAEPIMVMYNLEKKLVAVSMTFPYLMGLMSEKELEEYGFVKTDEGDGERWRNSAYAFHFYIKVTEDLKKSIKLYSN